jgi:hypothetical protein
MYWQKNTLKGGYIGKKIYNLIHEMNPVFRESDNIYNPYDHLYIKF